METFVLLLVIAFILYLIFRNKSSNTKVPLDDTNINSSAEPRDFLKDASGWLATPKPLSEMLRENKSYVMDKLFDFLKNGGTYDRKYAAFALGQIGDSNAIRPLENQLLLERVQGVREAIKAALTAFNLASSEKGYTELERRMLIDDAYNRRPPRITLR